MVVGNKEVGKTSLISALTNEHCVAPHIPHRTQGIEVNVERLVFKDLVCSLWDFAGQEIYYLSHTVHFTRRCIFCLVWSHVYTDTDDDSSGRELDLEREILRPLFTWLQMLFRYVPNAQLILIGSHSQLNTSLFNRRRAEVQDRVEAEVKRLNLCLDQERKVLHILLKQRHEDWHRCYDSCMSEGLCEEFDNDSDLLSFCKEGRFPMDSGILNQLQELALKYDEVRCRLCKLCGRFDFSDPCEDDETSQLQIKSAVAVDSRGDPDSVRQLKGALNEVGMGMSFIMHESKVPKWYREALHYVHQLNGEADPDHAASKNYKLGSVFMSRREIASMVQSQLLQADVPRKKSEQEIWDCLSFWSDLGETFVYDCPHFCYLSDTNTFVSGTTSYFYATQCF
jgi:hypothetical protein